MSDNVVYSPEFIPYYPQEAKQYGFTLDETIVYGFIRFYTKTGSKFYFSNSDIARITTTSERTVSRAIAKFDQLKIFGVVYDVKAGGGTIRFINPTRQIGESEVPLASVASQTRQIGESEIPQVVQSTDSSRLYNKTKKNNNSVSPIVVQGSQSGIEGFADKEYLENKAKNKVRQELKKMNGGRVPQYVKDKMLSKARLTVTQEVQSIGAEVRYPTLESVDESVIAEIATEKRVSIPDVEAVFETMKERVMGQGSGKWKDMAQMLRTFVSNAISYGTIEKILTFQERIEKEYGIKIDPNAKPSELTTYQNEEPAK